MYKSIITTVLIFMGLAAQAQNEHDKDSLRRALNKAVTDTGRVNTLLNLAYIYSSNTYIKTSLDTADLYLRQAQKLYKKQYGVAIQHEISLQFAMINCERNPDRDLSSQFLPILADCKKTGDKFNEMNAWIQMATYSYADPKLNPFRLNCYQHAVLLCHELNNQRFELFCIWQIANIYVSQFKYDLAESELFQILKTPKAEPEAILQTNNLIAQIYTAKAEYDKAALYAMKTVEIMEVTKDTINAYSYYGQLAYLHFVLKNFPLSLYWAKKWLNNNLVTNRLDDIYNASDYVVVGLLAEKKASEALKLILGIQAKYKPLNRNDKHLLAKDLGACYDALKENDLAEKYYLEMISIDPERVHGMDYASDKAASFNTIGAFYIKTGQFKKAKMYSLKALKYNKIAGIVSFLQRTYLSLFKADSALGNYRSAITDLQESNRLKDSMFTIAKNKQIEEVNISYQTEEREKDLKLVQNRANLEQVQLQHTETTRNWIIAGSGLLLIIAGLLYRQSRLRRKSNELITDKNEVITHKNELLQSLVEEKEWLLKEVHHRVKNNLHTVICLLESQAAYLQNDALEAIEKSQHRIYTMSLIHQKLYQSDDVKMIDMAVYIPELVKYLSDSFDVSNRVYFNLAIEPVNLNPAQAIPLALLINEALTNSIKYAFPNDRRGEITISLTDTGEQYKLVLADNGVGMFEDGEKDTNSLGLDLMKGLAKEIRGSIDIENNNGVKITVLFEHDALNELDMLEIEYLTSQPGEMGL
jgi:two-component sensor histidine kinase